jgi:CRISPR-associated protein Cmr4
MYKHKLYLIKNHTPMHVGSGDTNFDLVDRQIQKDPLTLYPTIHASSLKGALKEYCSFRHNTEESANFLAHIFGDEDNSGKIRFTQAHLLSVPMRADNTPYYNCTSPKAIEQLLDVAETFSLTLKDKEALKKIAKYSGSEALIASAEAVIEDISAKGSSDYDFKALEALIGAPAAIIPNELFSQMLKDLPVIARNQLENGESKNLWYEEVLPRESKLFTLISEPTYLNISDEKKLQNAFNRFNEYLSDKNTIHIGANASIGYGVTAFKEIGDA